MDQTKVSGCLVVSFAPGLNEVGPLQGTQDDVRSRFKITQSLPRKFRHVR